jgi:LysM repeat protein
MSGPQSASTRCGRVLRLLIGVVLLTSWVATAGPARAQNGTEDATQPTPADPESVIEVVATPAPFIVPTPGRPDDPLVHVTQVGETLYTLAARSGFAASELAKRNRLTNPYLLLAGQTIRLPQPLSANIHLHRVGAGDTLIGLAARYGVTPQHIRRANALTCQTCLVFGQLIRIATAGSAGGLPEPFQFIEVWPSVPQQGQVVTVRISTTLPLESIVGRAGRTTAALCPGSRRIHRARWRAGFALPRCVFRHHPGGAKRRTSQRDSGSGSDRRRALGYERLNIGAKLSTLLDPQVNQAEQETIEAVISQFSATQRWAGAAALADQEQNPLILWHATRL